MDICTVYLLQIKGSQIYSIYRYPKYLIDSPTHTLDFFSLQKLKALVSGFFVFVSEGFSFFLGGGIVFKNTKF